MNQETFNPINYHFRWTKDWYDWAYDEAHQTARKARSQRAKYLRSKGYAVTLSSRGGQQITRGGIGTKHPEITAVVTVYLLSYS